MRHSCCSVSTSVSIPSSKLIFSILGNTWLDARFPISVCHSRAQVRTELRAPQGLCLQLRRENTVVLWLGEHPHDGGSPTTPGCSPPSSPRHPRRPKSMQVSAGAPPPAPRHAPYGAHSISRATSHTSIEDANRESQSNEKRGHRGFMNGVRRISLVPGKFPYQRWL